MKKILVTAFEPFEGREVNASAEVLWALPERIGAFGVDRQLLPVVFGKAAGQVNPEGYDFIFLLGEAGRDSVTPETTARNLRSARIPDNGGNQPREEKILPDGPDEYHTPVPVRRIVEQMAAEGYEISVSDDAGAFVCNDTFYLVGTRSRVPVDFIHVPCGRKESQARTVFRFMELALS